MVTKLYFFFEQSVKMTEVKAGMENSDRCPLYIGRPIC